MDKIEEILTRGVANIIPSKAELNKLLQSGKKLNIYLGIDPTATRIHLGHAVGLRKLNQFAALGHNVTFVIGDFTALVGDTSDKESERPALTPEEIEENFKTYKKQAEKVIDFSKVQIRHNSEWLKDLTMSDLIKLSQNFSANDFLSRELIKKRLNEGKRVGLHEFLYPILQGFDSYHLDTDIQVGGTDQTFNMQAGRTLLKVLEQKDSFVLSTPILEGPDGRKMSKSWGNAIWLDDEPNEMFAKAMSIDDKYILTYFTLATSIPFEDIKEYEKKLKKENPINIKKQLARQIVTELHNSDAATEAEKNFEKTVQKKEMPSEVPTLKIEKSENVSLEDVLVKAEIAQSKSDAKRLIEQGGVTVNNEKIENYNLPISDLTDNGSLIIQVGKRKFVRIETE